MKAARTGAPPDAQRCACRPAQRAFRANLKEDSILSQSDTRTLNMPGLVGARTDSPSTELAARFEGTAAVLARAVRAERAERQEKQTQNWYTRTEANTGRAARRNIPASTAPGRNSNVYSVCQNRLSAG